VAELNINLWQGLIERLQGYVYSATPPTFSEAEAHEMKVLEQHNLVEFHAANDTFPAQWTLAEKGRELADALTAQVVKWRSSPDYQAKEEAEVASTFIRDQLGLR
jgi:hypothetical protein